MRLLYGCGVGPIKRPFSISASIGLQYLEFVDQPFKLFTFYYLFEICCKIVQIHYIPFGVSSKSCRLSRQLRRWRRLSTSRIRNKIMNYTIIFLEFAKQKKLLLVLYTYKFDPVRIHIMLLHFFGMLLTRVKVPAAKANCLIDVQQQ